jgi:hypothetical protein
MATAAPPVASANKAELLAIAQDQLARVGPLGHHLERRV